MNEGIDLQQYGRLTEQVSQLSKDMKHVNEQLENITKILSEAGGGWKALVYVGSAAAALTAAVGWVASHISFVK